MNMPTRFHKRAVASADGGDAVATSPTFDNTPIKRGIARFIDSLMGPRINTPSAAPIITEPDDGGVFVMPPTDGTSWVSSFHNAVTEATTRFAQRYVALVHNELPSFGFEIRELRIECKDAPAQFLSAVLSLPQNVLNLSAKSRMGKADGAEILFLDKFYGVTISAEQTLLGGQLVDTIISYSGSRFVLNFSFDGEFIERPEAFSVPAPTAVAAAVVQPAAPVGADASPVQTPEVVSFADIGAATTRRDPTLGTALRPMFPAGNPATSGQHTPLAQNVAIAPPAALQLRLRSLGSEVVVPLLDAHFPYTVGRHASFSGYSVRGRLAQEAQPVLHEVEKSNYVSFASREHLVLDSFDAVTQQLRVSTTKGTNGTFFKMAAMPKHFLLPIASMASGEWLKLGGKTGDGILEIRIETL